MRGTLQGQRQDCGGTYEGSTGRYLSALWQRSTGFRTDFHDAEKCGFPWAAGGGTLERVESGIPGHIAAFAEIFEGEDGGTVKCMRKSDGK